MILYDYIQFFFIILSAISAIIGVHYVTSVRFNKMGWQVFIDVINMFCYNLLEI